MGVRLLAREVSGVDQLFVLDGSGTEVQITQDGALASGIPAVETVSTTTYTILDTDSGKTLRFTNAGGCEVTLPVAAGAVSLTLEAVIGAGAVYITPSGTSVNGDLVGPILVGTAPAIMWLIPVPGAATEFDAVVSSSGSGSASYITLSDKNLPALLTVGDGDMGVASGVTSTPVPGYLLVTVNGQEVTVGNGTRIGVDSYFSADGGTTARSLPAVGVGDTFHWTGSIALYQLSTSDRVSFHYLQ